MYSPPKVRLEDLKSLERTRQTIRKYSLHTVCEESLCPNIWECFSSGHATFMILGKVCTKACKYCHVSTGRPLPPDPSEPLRLMQAVRELRLAYVVLTSVDRDDLPDLGSGHFRRCVDLLKDRLQIKVEALTPDFAGDERALSLMAQSRADVLAHNIEAVERVFRSVRPQGDYKRSLKVLRFYKESSGKPIKSGFMLGFGETMEDILKTMEDLREAGVDILVVGQYLRPSERHFPVLKLYTEEEFERIREHALSLGFKSVLSRPLARSSYRAEWLNSSFTKP